MFHQVQTDPGMHPVFFALQGLSVQHTSCSSLLISVLQVFCCLIISSFWIITGSRIPRETMLGGRTLDEYTTILQRGEFRNGRVENDGDLAVKTRSIPDETSVGKWLWEGGQKEQGLCSKTFVMYPCLNVCCTLYLFNRESILKKKRQETVFWGTYIFVHILLHFCC